MDAQRLVVSALLSFVACGSAVAIDWPKTYVVAEDTTSPDGKYALIVQNAENGAMNTGPIAGTDAVFLANIPEHKVIGEIKDVDYFERMNSRHLSAQWLDDSSACLVLESHWLYGVYGVHVVERTGQSIQQTDLMKRMLAMINPAEDRLNFYFRFETGPKVVVRATVPARQLEQTKSLFDHLCRMVELSLRDLIFDKDSEVPCQANVALLVHCLSPHPEDSAFRRSFQDD